MTPKRSRSTSLKHSATRSAGKSRGLTPKRASLRAMNYSPKSQHPFKLVAKDPRRVEAGIKAYNKSKAIQSAFAKNHLKKGQDPRIYGNVKSGRRNKSVSRTPSPSITSNFTPRRSARLNKRKSNINLIQLLEEDDFKPPRSPRTPNKANKKSPKAKRSSSAYFAYPWY